MFIYTFLAFFVLLHQKITAFIIFICFFDEVSNLCNRILTNQKPELVIRNCQRNCMVRAKTYDDISYGLALIVNQKWINKIYNLGKVDHRIPVLRSYPGAQKKTEIKRKYGLRMMVLKLE